MIGPGQVSSTSSPRLRGCSGAEIASVLRRAGRPRACGAVPSPAYTHFWLTWSSPRLRGCSAVLRLEQLAQAVVPAPAGLSPLGVAQHHLVGVVPAPAGLFPLPRRTETDRCQSSPRLRGCSVPEGSFTTGILAVPAPCGAVPMWWRWSRVRGWSSPRLRGCSRGNGVREHLQRVVPAPAGLFMGSYSLID